LESLEEKDFLSAHCRYSSGLVRMAVSWSGKIVALQRSDFAVEVLGFEEKEDSE
jgi:hypothetical protein